MYRKAAIKEIGKNFNYNVVNPDIDIDIMKILNCVEHTVPCYPRSTDTCLKIYIVQNCNILLQHQSKQQRKKFQEEISVSKVVKHLNVGDVKKYMAPKNI